jgi:hypothetical protein
MINLYGPANTAKDENKAEKEDQRRYKIYRLENPVLFVWNFQIVSMAFHRNIHNVVKKKLNY